MFPGASVAGAAQQRVGRSRSASIVQRGRILPSMNDNDTVETVRGPSALTARPSNGARVVTHFGSGRRCAPPNPRSSRHRAARGYRPLVIVGKLRLPPITRGAAQLAPRYAHDENQTQS